MNQAVIGQNLCTTNPAKVYIQYTCTEGVTALNQKREQGLAISAIASFVAVLFLVVVTYL